MPTLANALQQKQMVNPVTADPNSPFHMYDWNPTQFPFVAVNPNRRPEMGDLWYDALKPAIDTTIKQGVHGAVQGAGNYFSLFNPQPTDNALLYDVKTGLQGAQNLYNAGVETLTKPMQMYGDAVKTVAEKATMTKEEERQKDAFDSVLGQIKQNAGDAQFSEELAQQQALFDGQFLQSALGGKGGMTTPDVTLPAPDSSSWDALQKAVEAGRPKDAEGRDNSDIMLALAEGIMNGGSFGDMMLGAGINLLKSKKEAEKESKKTKEAQSAYDIEMAKTKLEIEKGVRAQQKEDAPKLHVTEKGVVVEKWVTNPDGSKSLKLDSSVGDTYNQYKQANYLAGALSPDEKGKTNDAEIMGQKIAKWFGSPYQGELPILLDLERSGKLTELLSEDYLDGTVKKALDDLELQSRTAAGAAASEDVLNTRIQSDKVAAMLHILHTNPQIRLDALKKLNSIRGGSESTLPFEQSSIADLTEAVAQVESGGRNVDADGNVITSNKGAKGKMQVMDATNLDPGYGVVPAKDNSLAERQRVGEDYLAALIQHYDNPILGTLAYNWGPGNVDNHIKTAGDPRLGKITFDDFLEAVKSDEARNYVPKVYAQLGKK